MALLEQVLQSGCSPSDRVPLWTFSIILFTLARSLNMENDFIELAAACEWHQCRLAIYGVTRTGADFKLSAFASRVDLPVLRQPNFNLNQTGPVNKHRIRNLVLPNAPYAGTKYELPLTPLHKVGGFRGHRWCPFRHFNVPAKNIRDGPSLSVLVYWP